MCHGCGWGYVGLVGDEGVGKQAQGGARMIVPSRSILGRVRASSGGIKVLLEAWVD